MDFLKKASYLLSNNQNLRRGVFISIAIIFLLVVVLFNSDIQNLLNRPGAGKAAGPVDSDLNWEDLDNIETPRSNAKMIDVVQDGQRWLYLIGGTETVWDDGALNEWYQVTGGDRLSLVSTVERMRINPDGSPIVDEYGVPSENWEEAPEMNFGHAEFGLIEYDNYIYVISGDIHAPVVEDENNEFPLLYSTIERLAFNDAEVNKGEIISFTKQYPTTGSIFMYDILNEEEKQITDTNIQHFPDISGDKIVWQDDRNGNWDIYMYDISTSTETQITSNNLDQISPAIHGDTIVWADARSEWGIYMYDISTSTETKITTDNSSAQLFPDIYGDKIVWMDVRNGDWDNWDIYMYDISTSTEIQITTNSNEQYYPAIYGDKIVWQDDRNGNWDIYMYDISTSTEIQITTNSNEQYYPAIYGDKIVWQDDRNGNWDIYMYDISTSTEKQITTDTAYQGTPAISGDRIVWEDNRNGIGDVYMYNISTSTETQIITDTDNQGNPAIYGDRIVWEGDCSDDGLITVTTKNPHGLSNSDKVTISGTLNYNGVHIVHNVTVNTFDITVPWLGSEFGEFGGSWVENKWEIVALISGLNFYPEIEIYNDQLHIVGGVYGNPFDGNTFNTYGIYGAKDPLIIDEDNVWDSIKDKPIVGGDIPLIVGNGGLDQSIIGMNNPAPPIIVPDPIGGIFGGSVISYAPNLNTGVMIQQVDPGAIRNDIDGLPPWYPVEFSNLNLLFSQLLLNGQFYTTVSEHYILNLNPTGSLNSVAGELDSDYITDDPLVENTWKIGEVIKIGHLRVMISLQCYSSDDYFFVISPVPQGRYGHKLFNFNGELIVIGGASWSNPYNWGTCCDGGTVSYLFWVIEDEIHPFTLRDHLWGGFSDSSYDFDYKYIGNITYKWDANYHYWEGTNTNMASDPRGSQLIHEYAFSDGDYKKGRAFFGLAELNSADGTNSFVASAGLENENYYGGDDLIAYNEFYIDNELSYYCYARFGIPIQITDRVEIVKDFDNGWKIGNNTGPETAYGLTSIGIDNYRSIAINGQTDFQIASQYDSTGQWSNTHVPTYDRASSNKTSMFDNSDWVEMPSESGPTSLENLAYAATFAVRVKQSGITTLHIYRAGGTIPTNDLPNSVYHAQVLGPFIYGTSGMPNLGTSEFSIVPPEVLADGMHYATASGVLRDYYDVPVVGQEIALTIDDTDFLPIYDGDVKVLPVPDNLKARAQDTPDMTVIVNAGCALFDDGSGGFNKVAIPATDSPQFEQPISNNRIDLLVITSDGSLDIIKGIPDSPDLPVTPNNTKALAVVYLRSGQTEILNSDYNGANYVADVRLESLKFGAGNSSGQAGYAEEFIETDESGAFQFRLSSTIAATHEVWLWVNMSIVPDTSWFVRVGPWDVDFVLEGVPTRLSSIVADPNQVSADGIDSSTVTVTLLDGYGDAAPGYWVDIYSNRNEFTTNGYISAFADGVETDGKVIVESANHGLPEGSNITISGTTNYDGIYIISDSNINTFGIEAVWVSDDAMGMWTIDLVDNISLESTYDDPVSDINGQVKFMVNSSISGLALIRGKYSIKEDNLSFDYKNIKSGDTIEFGGHIASLEPDYGYQGQALEYIIATGAQTNWDSNTEVEFIPPGEINFQTIDGSAIEDLRIIANGQDSASLKIVAPDYPNAELDLIILEGSGSFFGSVPTSLTGFGEATFIYTAGIEAGIVKIIANIDNDLVELEEEVWFIEDEPIANNYELEITVNNPHLDENINETEVKSAIWLYAGSNKVIVDGEDQINSFTFSSDDNSTFMHASPVDSNNLGVVINTYIKDTEDGKALIFVEVDFKPTPTSDAIHLMASQLIVKKSAGSVNGITPDSLTVINSEKIDLGGETITNEYVHISENAKIGLWTVSIYTPNVFANDPEIVQHPFRVLPSGVGDYEPRIVSIQPWYGLFGETNKVIDIIGINTTFQLDNWRKSVVSFTNTDVSQPTNAITVTSVHVDTSTHLQVTINVSEETAALGWYNVSVTTGVINDPNPEIAIKPGDQDFLVTGESNFALYLYSNVGEVPRDGQSQANITARVVFIDPTDGSITPREDVDIEFNHSDAGPIKPPTLAPLETSTNDQGFAYSLYTTDAGDVNELIDITATAWVYPLSGDPVIISNKINILKVVHPYNGFILSANPDSIPLYGEPDESRLTAEGLPSGNNIHIWFEMIMGDPKGYILPLQTSTNTGTALSRYYAAPAGERVPETVEVEAFAIVPGIGIIKSNSALIQIGEADADYKLSLTAVPDEVQAGGLLVSNITAALTFLDQPSSNWPIDFDLIQEQAGDYLTETYVWTDYPTGLAKTKFVPGYIAGDIMVIARPLGLDIAKSVTITKVANQNPDEHLTTVTAVPRYVPTSTDGSDFSVVTVTVRNENFTPLENVVVKLTTNRTADTIRLLSDGSINDTTNTNENGQAIFRVSSTETSTEKVPCRVEAIVGTFSVITTIIFEDPSLLTSRFLDIRVPFQSRDYDNLTWVYVSEETTGDPLVFANEVYTKLGKPDDRLSVLKDIKMYFHLDETYNLWTKGRNHLSRVEQFFPGDKTGEGETIDIDMTRIINSKEYGLFVADVKPDLRDIDGNANMVPSPFHDNAINAFDFGLLIDNFYANHYTANINWPIDEIVNNFDTLFIFLNYGSGEEGGPPPYK